MLENRHHALALALLFAVALLTLSGCGPVVQKQQPRFFWPPPPEEAKIEYINFYFTNEDLLRGVDRRLEHAILGQRIAERLINRPYSVASDSNGRIFVGDFIGRRVTVLDRPEHTSRVLLEMQGTPRKVVVDQRGEIWVLDGEKTTVHHFAADEKLIANLELKGMGRAASLAVDSHRQRLYLSDVPNHRICVYDYTGTLLYSFGTRGRNPGQLNFPADIDLDTVGNLYVVDAMNARIQIFTPEGDFIRAFGERGTAPGSFSAAKGIAVSPSNLVYVTDANLNKVVIFNSAGEYLLTLGGNYIFDGKHIQPGGFYFPVGIDVDSTETIFIADYLNGMIHEFQYLTPAFLARHPIRPEQVYHPQTGDFGRDDLKNDIGRLPPAILPDGAEQKAPGLQPYQGN